jgi:hypothetical protein
LTYGEALETQRRNFATDVLVRRWFDFVQLYIVGIVDPREMGSVDLVTIPPLINVVLISSRLHVVVQYRDCRPRSAAVQHAVHPRKVVPLAHRNGKNALTNPQEEACPQCPCLAAQT